MQLCVGDFALNRFCQLLHQNFDGIVIPNTIPCNDVTEKNLLIDAGNVFTLCRVLNRLRKASILQIFRAITPDASICLGLEQCSGIMGNILCSQVFVKVIRSNVFRQVASAQCCRDFSA